jgi:hypothetical protein
LNIPGEILILSSGCFFLRRRVDWLLSGFIR